METVNVTTKKVKNKVNRGATKADANPNTDKSVDLINPVVTPGDRQDLGKAASAPVKHNTNPFPNTGNANDLKSPSLANIETVKGKVHESVDFSDDLKNIFEKEELGVDFSQDFYKDISNLLEAAVRTKVRDIAEELDEAYSELLAEEVTEIKESLEEKVDNFLSVTCESWTEENQLAIEYGVRNELTESFIDGLKTLFESHYVEIPDEKYDVVSSLEENLEELKEDFSKLYEDNVTLKEELDIMAKREILFHESLDLTEVEKEKFFELAENLIDADIETFERKVAMIKENHFSEYESTYLTEDVDDVEYEDYSALDSAVASIASVI